ncbi:MAG: glycosyltransferase family 39 protein [Phycisphaerales bacterium]
MQRAQDGSESEAPLRREDAASSGTQERGPAPGREWRIRPSTVIGGVALVLLCLVVYLPGFFSLPVVDRDEARFAQASRQMLEAATLPESERRPEVHGGGWLVPMVQDRVRLNKPPLIYWLQAGSAWVFSGGNAFRDAIWMYRVPSLLAAVAAAMMVWRLGASMFDARVGWVGAALLAVSPMVAWEAHQARADLVLLAATVAAMWGLWEVWKRAGGVARHSVPVCCDQTGVDGAAERTGSESRGTRTLRWAVVFWVAVAAGVMTKGPATPLVAGLCALALSVSGRRWRWLLRLRPEIGVMVLLLAVGPWVWAVAERVGWGSYWQTVLDETLGRGVAAREGHWGLPGYHTLLLPVLLWPGSLLTLWGVLLAWRAFRRRGEDTGGRPDMVGAQAAHGTGDGAQAARGAAEAYRFCFAWFAPAWIVFELVTTKLPHYTLPMYPALALLSARAVFAATNRALEVRRLGLVKVPWVAIGAAICIGLPAACFAIGVRHSWSIIPLGLVWVLGLVIWVDQWRRPWDSPRWLGRQLAGIVAMAATAPLLFQAVMPGAKKLWLSQRVMEVVRSADPAGARPLAAMEFHEDSLVFLTRGRVTRLNEADAGAWWRANPGGLMVLPTSKVLRLHSPVGEVEGFNYSRGKWERLTVVGMPAYREQAP